jgi:hypothetical protein
MTEPAGPGAPTDRSRWQPISDDPGSGVESTFSESTFPGMMVWLTARRYNAPMEYGPTAVGTSSSVKTSSSDPAQS